MALCEAGTEIWVGVLESRPTKETDTEYPLHNPPAPAQFASNQGKSQDQKKKKNAKKDLLHSNVAVQKLEFILNSQKKKKKQGKIKQPRPQVLG